MVPDRVGVAFVESLMSRKKKTQEPSATPRPTRASSAAKRVDTAHVRADEAIASPVASAPAAPPARVPQRTEVLAVSGQAERKREAPLRLPEPLPAVTAQQVRTQATQLAAHLQRQQAAVDHREAELNARLATMENQLRSARLWLSERHAELAERKNDLDRRERDLSGREVDLRHPQRSVKKSLAPLAATVPEAELAERQAELDQREAELAAMATRLGDQLALADQSRDAQNAMRAIITCRENLERAEKSLAGEAAGLEHQRRQLTDERAAFAETIGADRQKLAEEQQRAIAEHDKTRRELKRQADDLTARQAALERMRADVARSQQDVLETRLATEELWARLCGTMAPAALTQSLAQIRLKLAEEQRMARSELSQQKAEIQALSARLAEQHQKLAQQRQDFQAWATERQRDLERQAGVLVAQQQHMDEQRAALADETAHWRSERFGLQQEIRRLTRQMSRTEIAAA
jgi:chromosome segregation ATPase